MSSEDWRPKVREMIRELIHCEDHLVEKYPSLAREVRAFRIKLEGKCLYPVE